LSLKRYYTLLGLEEGATEQEIRRKYRSLAMRFHPDKNPSPAANEKFIQLTEAYEILLKKRDNPTTKKETRPKAKSAEDRVKEAKKRFHEQRLKEQMENERYYQSLLRGRKWRIIKLNAVIGLILAILLISDVFLPRHYEQDRVTHYSRDVYSGIGGKAISLISTKNNNDLWIEGLNFSLYSYYPTIYIERSWIFHDPISVISIQKISHQYFKAHYTFYSITFLTALIMLIPAFTLWYKRRTIIFTILWHFSLYFTGTVILIFLLANNHWAHLLTLGFI
jgi:ElaB/YqjD/DUF883 family membrane-anchored ribosome-binding protein